MSVKKKKSKVNVNEPGHLPESLPGFDIKDGLERMSNDQELYLELLEFFRKDSKKEDWIVQVKTALKDGDIDHARSLVHNIKGVSGNIGATQLFLAAKNLEKALKADENKLFQSLYKIFENELNTVMESLEKIKPEL